MRPRALAFLLVAPALVAGCGRNKAAQCEALLKEIDVRMERITSSERVHDDASEAAHVAMLEDARKAIEGVAVKDAKLRKLQAEYVEALDAYTEALKLFYPSKAALQSHLPNESGDAHRIVDGVLKENHLAAAGDAIYDHCTRR